MSNWYSTLVLGPREVHLWYLHERAAAEPFLLQAGQDVLSNQEQDRHNQLRLESVQQEYLLTRALVRLVLSRYLQADPRSLVFEANAYGRPMLVSPASLPGLCFNLSHSHGLVALAVTLDREVGVDVEDPLRRRCPEEIADRFFSPTEIKALRDLPAEARRERFYRYWTLKEAYIKARGLGLALPLDQFSFHLEPGRPASISFSHELNDDPQAWQFAQYDLAPRHIGALAVRRGREPDLEILSHDIVGWSFAAGGWRLQAKE